MPVVHQAREGDDADPAIIPQATKRGTLDGLLRMMDFAQASASLSPDAKGTPGGDGPTPMPRGQAAALAQILPGAMAEIEQAPTEPKKQAEAESDKSGGEAKADQVQSDAGGGAMEPVQRKAKGSAKGAGGAETPTLTYPVAKAAVKWGRRQRFAKTPFHVRRFQEALGSRRNGQVDFALVRAIFDYQQQVGLKPANGRLNKRTRKALLRKLKRTKKLTKSGLTRTEKREAYGYNQRLKRPTIRKLRKLLGLSATPAVVGPGVLKAILRFQRKHKLTAHGRLDKRTRKKIAAENESKWTHPLPGAVMTSPFGRRFHPIHKEMRMHEGVDFSGPTGIVAANSGTVQTVANDASGWGNYLIIQHKGYATLYAHCASIKVKVGQRVRSGQRVATAGNTGGSRGVHLHFEVHKPRFRNPVDPMTVL